jgi:hypothetical protein
MFWKKAKMCKILYCLTSKCWAFVECKSRVTQQDPHHTLLRPPMPSPRLMTKAFTSKVTSRSTTVRPSVISIIGRHTSLSTKKNKNKKNKERKEVKEKHSATIILFSLLRKKRSVTTYQPDRVLQGALPSQLFLSHRCGTA